MSFVLPGGQEGTFRSGRQEGPLTQDSTEPTRGRSPVSDALVRSHGLAAPDARGKPAARLPERHLVRRLLAAAAQGVPMASPCRDCPLARQPLAAHATRRPEKGNLAPEVLARRYSCFNVPIPSHS